MVSRKAFHAVCGDIMVMKYMLSSVAAALLFFTGCTDLTEFDQTVNTGINIISTPDLSIVHTIENIPGASSLCPLQGCFLVATTEGTVIRYDSQTYQQTGSFTIGSPSSAGYFEMEYSPNESSVYIIGAFGEILEYHVPDMEFMDNFTVCESPVDIEIGTQIELPYLYIAGAASSKIFEVRYTTNIVSRSCLLYYSPTCMAINQPQDTILIGTLGGTEIVSTGTGTMRRRAMPQFEDILAIETIPDDTTLCAVFDYGSSKIGTILGYFQNPFSSSPILTGLVTISGNLHFMCSEADGSHVYVLSYLGDSTSRLVSYNCLDYSIENQADLQGYPVDLEICPGGTLLVLTAQ